MKKKFLAILLVTATFYSSNAQQHHFSGGVGVLSTNYIADTFFNVAKNVISDLAGSDTKLENQNNTLTENYIILVNAKMESIHCLYKYNMYKYHDYIDILTSDF